MVPLPLTVGPDPSEVLALGALPSTTYTSLLDEETLVFSDVLGVNVHVALIFCSFPCW